MSVRSILGAISSFAPQRSLRVTGVAPSDGVLLGAASTRHERRTRGRASRLEQVVPASPGTWLRSWPLDRPWLLDGTGLLYRARLLYLELGFGHGQRSPHLDSQRETGEDHGDADDDPQNEPPGSHSSLPVAHSSVGAPPHYKCVSAELVVSGVVQRSSAGVRLSVPVS